MTVTKRYTLVGNSLIDANGIIPSIPNGSYIQTTDNIAANSQFDIIIKVRFETASTNTSIIARNSSDTSANVCVFGESSPGSNLGWWSNDNNSSATLSGSFLVANQWCFVRLRYTDKLYLSAKVSTSAETLAEALQSNSWAEVEADATNPANGNKWNIGYTPFNSWGLNGASVDLTNSSINGNLFYEDSSQPFVPSINIGSDILSACYLGNSTVDKIYAGDVLVYDNTTPPIPSDPYYTWDLTTVGTLTENDGVYSGFDSSNYLEMKTNHSGGVTSFEISLYFETGSTVGYECLLGNHANKDCPEVCIYNNQIEIDLPTTSSSWFAYFNSGSNTITTNTKYHLKFVWSGLNAYTGTLTDLDNNVESSITMTYNSGSHNGTIGWVAPKIGCDQDGLNTFNGSIDLKNSYIKVNRDYIDCSINNAPQYNDYWTSHFDWGNGIISCNNGKSLLASVNISDTDRLERFYKVIFQNGQKGIWSIVDYWSYSYVVGMWIDGRWRPAADGAGFSDQVISSFGTINPTSDVVYFRYIYDPTQSSQTISASRDKTNWSSISTGSITTGQCEVSVLNRISGGYTCTGVFIDTTESYIKVNDDYMVRPYNWI